MTGKFLALGVALALLSPLPAVTGTPAVANNTSPSVSPESAGSSAAPAPIPSTSAATPYVGGTTIAWTAQNVPVVNGPYPPYRDGFFGGSLDGVAAGPQSLVAAGSDYGILSKPGYGSAASWVSTDGAATWTEHPVGGADPGFTALVAHGGVFVASSLAGGFWYSSDGASWTRATSGPTNTGGISDPRRVALAPGLGGFVGIVWGGGSTQAWKSIDGTEWSAAPLQPSLQGFYPQSLAATTERALAVGASGSSGRLLVSSDGLHWSRVALPAGMDATRATISVADLRFLIVAPYTDATHYGTAVWSSLDGVRWERTSFLTARTASPDRVGNVVPFGAGWIAAGWAPNGADDCTPIVWTTPDLVHWARAALPSTPWPGTCEQPVRIAASGGRAIAAGSAWDMVSTSPAAWIGTLVSPPQPQLALHQASAAGVTPSGPFTLSTKVVRAGRYMTIRIATSPALAGAHVGIWIAMKGSDGRWSAFSPHTGRIGDAQGVVTYYYRAQSAAWLSFQAHIAADATHPAAVSNAVQARWVS